MKKEYSLKIDNEDIVFADLTDRENLEAIIVCKSGNIFLFDCQTKESSHLTELSFSSYQLNLQIHGFENYICITQKNGLQGMVIDLSDPNFLKKLERIDYHAAHCLFPIAFYKKENQTFLIHGTDWNRLDITCLETDKLLTDRIVDYDTKSNYFDYFHSSLSISPDSKNFISNGWHWHPFGQITLYSIDDFQKKFELSHKYIELTDQPYDLDWDRPLCWIDEKTLAIGFNKSIEDYGETKFPNEILFVDINENKIVDRIKFDGFGNTSEEEVFGELFYDKENTRFISLNKKKGLLITDIGGRQIYKDVSLTSHKYSNRHKLFYKTDQKPDLLEIVRIQA